MRLAVMGCAGRMGRANLAAAFGATGVDVVAGIETTGHPAIGTDLGLLAGGEPRGVTVSDDAATALGQADAAIDFTSPAATRAHADLAVVHGCALVIGTTGLDASDLEALDRAAAKVAMVVAPNMSRGVNLLLELTEVVARALDASFDVEIVELHHGRKVDAPSGTALALGEAAAKGRGVALDDVAERGRDGLTGPREAGRIGFAALRGGDAVGDHTVLFAGPGERLELTHRAGDRGIYAHGALQAAFWLQDRAPGRYGMADVLGLRPPADHRSAR
ncbi:MAG: 4-hydroxy-tetrahydrodipicolinate reductase [Pseudomonadota bacterium]